MTIFINIILDDTEKIRSANIKADLAARTEEQSSQKLTVVSCIDSHIQQNKGNIINFLKQTTDKIFAVGFYLRQRVISNDDNLE